MRSVSLRGISPKPDPRSALAYSIIFFLIVTTISMFALTGMRLDGTWPWSLMPLAAFVIANAWMLRRAGHDRIGSGLETVSLMVVKASFVLVLQYALMALPIDFKDGWLLAADRIFGFDWLAFNRFANATLTFELLAFSYNSLIWQGVLLLILFCATGRDGRAWQTLTAAIVALAITTTVFTFFPADGRYAGCGPAFVDVPARHGMCDYGVIIHRIKDEGLRLIDVTMATGLVAMPSFHAAAGAIFVWAGWSFKWLRAPVLLLNALMWVATITVGAHYMVDVPAGIAVAALSIWIAKRYVSAAPVSDAQAAATKEPALT